MSFNWMFYVTNKLVNRKAVVLSHFIRAGQHSMLRMLSIIYVHYQEATIPSKWNQLIPKIEMVESFETRTSPFVIWRRFVLNVERKLFVGMVSKNLDEPNIRALFQSYGNIEDCTVLRDANGKSRGTSFDLLRHRSVHSFLLLLLLRLCFRHFPKTSMRSECNQIDASISNDGSESAVTIGTVQSASDRLSSRVVLLHLLLNLPIPPKIKKRKKFNNNSPLITILWCNICPPEIPW